MFENSGKFVWSAQRNPGLESDLENLFRHCCNSMLYVMLLSSTTTIPT